MHISRTKSVPMPPETFTADGNPHPRWTEHRFWSVMYEAAVADEPERQRRIARDRLRRQRARDEKKAVA